MVSEISSSEVVEGAAFGLSDGRPRGRFVGDAAAKFASTSVLVVATAQEVATESNISSSVVAEGVAFGFSDGRPRGRLVGDAAARFASTSVVIVAVATEVGNSSSTVAEGDWTSEVVTTEDAESASSFAMTFEVVAAGDARRRRLCALDDFSVASMTTIDDEEVE